MPVLLTVLTTGLAATSSTYPARATNALGPRCASAAMVAAAVARLPGMPSPQDDGAFSDDPAGFCAKGLRAHGPVFSTGVAGGSVFVGDAASLTALGSASTKVSTPTDGSCTTELAAPFAAASMADGAAEDLFAAHAEALRAYLGRK